MTITPGNQETVANVHLVVLGPGTLEVLGSVASAAVTIQP